MKSSKIQWCDGTCNPGMGCGGLCEMWPRNSEVVKAVVDELLRLFPDIPKGKECFTAIVKKVLRDYDGTNLYANREEYIYDIESAVANILPSGSVDPSIRNEYERLFKCYAGKITVMRAGHAGYPISFEKPKMFSGRMAETAKQPNLYGESRLDKPWLDGCGRLVFVSDMGDVLSREIPFDFLKQEIIDVVTSEDGRQHLWLWLTKNPKRMAEFDEWLKKQDIGWPDNLVAMTTVTSQSTAYRVDHLRKVRAKIKGLSVEPLWEAVTLDLNGIDWVIVGGESGARDNAEPFDLAWARSLRDQCKKSGACFFLKQLGSNVLNCGQPQQYQDLHGGDWKEWPHDLKIREVPQSFKQSTKAISVGTPAH